jgi:hypothetical protein
MKNIKLSDIIGDNNTVSPSQVVNITYNIAGTYFLKDIY